jgi:hypothetical protein
VKDSFYKELERVFDKFPKYHMKILLGDFTAKVGREDIFKLTIGNESMHEISNDNGVRLVNFATSKNLRVKSTMFPHRNIQKKKYTLTASLLHYAALQLSICSLTHLDLLSYIYTPATTL